MPALTFVTTCKGRLTFLKQTLPCTAAQADAEVVVVDYDCPENAGIWVKENFPNVKVVSVKDAPLFHAAHARNLGAAEIRTPWVCFCDCDILFEPAFSENLSPLLKAGYFYQARPITRGAVGTVVMRHEDFVNVGGYDEAITEWGCEDRELYDRLVWRGVQRADFPGAWLKEIQHSDELRTVHHAIKDLRSVYRINLLYPEIKQAVTQVLRRALSLEERKALYQEIQQAARATPLDDTMWVEVKLPDLNMARFKEAQTLERKLTFSLKPAKQ